MKQLTEIAERVFTQEFVLVDHQLSQAHLGGITGEEPVPEQGHPLAQGRLALKHAAHPPVQELLALTAVVVAQAVALFPALFLITALQHLHVRFNGANHEAWSFVLPPDQVPHEHLLARPETTAHVEVVRPKACPVEEMLYGPGVPGGIGLGFEDS